MIKNWLITGDTHGFVLSRLQNIDTEIYTPEETAVIILGDMGLNFYLNNSDTKNKQAVNDTHFHIYAVRGNHEARPESLGMNQLWDTYIKGAVYYEPEFPYIRYLIDGEEYEIDGHSVLVIGGAYSVDKWYRLLRAGYSEKDALQANPKRCGWFKDEQLTAEEMKAIEDKCIGRSYDFIFAHTCPLSWEPIDLFLRGIDQSKVDNSMEVWLDSFKDKIDWKIFLWGHFHDDRIERPHCEMFYQEIEELNHIWNRWYGEKTFKNEWWLNKSPNFHLDDNPYASDYNEKGD